jgi:hypothetical protein
MAFTANFLLPGSVILLASIHASKSNSTFYPVVEVELEPAPPSVDIVVKPAAAVAMAAVMAAKATKAKAATACTFIKKFLASDDLVKSH